MEIDKTRVISVGGKVRQIGDDAHTTVERMAPKMQPGTQSGLASIATLRQVVERLNQQSRNLALDSQENGNKLMAAAENHHANDEKQAHTFTMFDPSILSGGN